MAKAFQVEEIQEFRAIPRSPTATVRVRVQRYNGNPVPVVDVREFVASDRFTGYTPKGMGLSLAEFDALMAQAAEIREVLVQHTRVVLPLAA